MSDDKEKTTPKLTTRENGPPFAMPPARQQHHLDLVGQRIASPETPVQDAITLTRIRNELIRQEEYRKDCEHARSVEKRQFWGKMAFSGGAVCVGGGLIALGHPLEGFAVMGIGFHWLAPDFVKSIYDRLLGKEGRQDGK